jgi:hypothetical protein
MNLLLWYRSIPLGWVFGLSLFVALVLGFALGMLSVTGFKISIAITEDEMANKFNSILKDVGKGLLFVFTNKTALSIESGGLTLAEVIWPGLSPLFTKLTAAIAKAQAQATVSTEGMTEAQIAALVLTDAEADFQAAGITETTQQQAIIAAAINLIDLIPSGSVNAAVVTAAVKTAAGSPAGAAPAASAATTAAVATAAAAPQSGPGLHTVVPA